MNKRAWILSSLFFVALALIAGLIVVYARAFPYIRERLQNDVAQACATCELVIGDLGLSAWSPGSVVARDLRFRAGSPGGQEVKAQVRELVVRPYWRALLKGNVLIDELIVLAPDVTFLDGDKRAPGKAGSGGLPNFAILATRIEDGRFTYVRDHKGTHAVLRIGNIDLRAGSISRSDVPTEFTAKAQIEGSGAIDLRVAIEWREPLRLETDVRVRDQGLPELSRFFKPNAGVDLQGTLVRGHARGHLNGRRLRTNVRAVYKDFALKVDATYDRSEVVAFFTNLGAAIALQDENLDDAPEDQARTVETERKDDESIVAFLLRGMKEASLKIVKRER